MNPPRRRIRQRRTRHAQAAFITVGTLAAIATAGLAVGTLTGTIPPAVAVLMAGALAAWVYAIVRLVGLAATSDSLTLDCRHGVHAGCLICGCACHRTR